MRYHDTSFRQEIKNAAPKMPDSVANHFDETLASFQARPAKRPTPLHTLRLAFLILLILFILLPNISPTIAHAMQGLPVIGDWIRVITIYKIDEGNDFHYRKVNIPQVTATNGTNDAVDYINADVDTLTQVAMSEYEATVEAFPEAHLGMIIDYEVVTNTDDWFTLRLMVYQEAGSSNVTYYFYHIDKVHGTLVELSDLFREDFDYQTPISDEIKAQMRRQYAENHNIIYWTGEKNHTFASIDKNQNFYFNDDDDLVIVFGKYEVAPGYMGCPEFVIPREIYEAGLTK